MIRVIPIFCFSVARLKVCELCFSRILSTLFAKLITITFSLVTHRSDTGLQLEKGKKRAQTHVYKRFITGSRSFFVRFRTPVAVQGNTIICIRGAMLTLCPCSNFQKQQTRLHLARVPILHAAKLREEEALWLSIARERRILRLEGAERRLEKGAELEIGAFDEGLGAVSATVYLQDRSSSYKISHTCCVRGNTIICIRGAIPPVKTFKSNR